MARHGEGRFNRPGLDWGGGHGERVNRVTDLPLANRPRLSQGPSHPPTPVPDLSFPYFHHTRGSI